MNTLHQFTVTNFHKCNEAIKDFHRLLSPLLNGNLSYEDLYDSYFSVKPCFMDVTYIMTDGLCIGVLGVIFYRIKRFRVCRTVIAIKGNVAGNLPCWHICKKFIKYKLQHPVERFILVAYVVNPLIFSMICKYARYVYPKPGIAETPIISEIRKMLGKKAEGDVQSLKVKVDIQVIFDEQLMKRIYSSRNKPYVRYYLKLNADFDHNQTAIMTIVPISWPNVISSCYRALIVKPIQRVKKHVEKWYVGIIHKRTTSIQ
jgi:hypothetical protein